MISKKQVNDLISILKIATGKTQGQLAIGAGMKPKTVSQQLSREESLHLIYDRLMTTYKDQLQAGNSVVPNNEMYSHATMTTKAGVKATNGKDDRDRLIEELKERIKFLEKQVEQLNQILIKQLEKS